jgi:3-methyladenine DNA glycosylase AlkD
MKTIKKARPAKSTLREHDVDQVVAELRRLSSEKYRQGMARFAIPSDKAFGVPVGEIRALGKRLGRSSQLAAELWATGWYEARMLAVFVEDPANVTPSQMDQWCRDFDSWAICDTACVHLFDRTPHASKKIKAWATRRDEFVKRAAFALLASMTLHDKLAPDDIFAEGLELIEATADDERNFVKKAVNWALRSIGKRNQTLHAAAVAAAQRLAELEEAAPRWIGKDALRELKSKSVTKRLAKRKVAK